MSEKQLTKPGVFIIESLSFDDEQFKRFEGQLIANILDLNLIPSKYYYMLGLTYMATVNFNF